MIDIHTHILPGVDDGSASIQESLYMLKTAYQCGVKSFVITPHCNHPEHRNNYYGDWFENSFNELKKEVTKLLPINLYPGMEIFLTTEVPHLIKQNKLITINNSKYILVEFSFDDLSDNVIILVNSLLKLNLIPIIAHPERYKFVANDNGSILSYLFQIGCLMQVNKGSILGRFGKTARKISLYMLNNRLAHVIASDAHSPFERTTYMEDVYYYVCSEYSTKYADLLFNINPLKIINNEKID